MRRSMFGPDVAASLTFDELRMLPMLDAVTMMDSCQVDKAKMAEWLRELRWTVGRSMAFTCAIPPAAIRRLEMLAARKPSGGLPREVEQTAGRRFARDITKDRILGWSYLVEDGA